MVNLHLDADARPDSDAPASNSASATRGEPAPTSDRVTRCRDFADRAGNAIEHGDMREAIELLVSNAFLAADAVEQQQRDIELLLRSRLPSPPVAQDRSPEPQLNALDAALVECDSPAARARFANFLVASAALRSLARFLDTPIVIAGRNAADRRRVADVLILAERLEVIGADLMREVTRAR